MWAKSFYEKNPANLLKPGEFDIPSVPAGDYMLTVWRLRPERHHLLARTSPVRPGEQTDWTPCASRSGDGSSAPSSTTTTATASRIPVRRASRTSS